MNYYGISQDVINSCMPAARIIAKTTDGTEYSNEHLFLLTPLASYLRIGNNWKTDTYRHDEINGKYTYPLYSDAWAGAMDFTVTSSNSKVISGYCGYDSSTNGYYLYVVPHATGSAKVTVSLLDGSGKKASITIKVE